MPVRVRLALALAVGFLAVGAIALLVTSGGGATSVAAPGTFAGAVRPPGAHAPAVALRDQEGRPVRLAAPGAITVVSFLYTTCRDTCPITAQQIRGALDELGDRAATVRDVAVSVDPANDTPALARRFVTNQSLTGRMRFALGTRAQLAPVWRAFGIQPQTSREEHSGYVVLVDGRGRQRIGFPVDRLTPEGLAHDLAMLQRERA